MQFDSQRPHGQNGKQPRVYFITGAGGGIGGELARRLHGRGERVAVADINAEALGRRLPKAQPADCLRLTLDVTSAESWQSALNRTVTHFGRIDCLLNVAGFLNAGSLLDVATEEIDRHLDVNARGVMYGTVQAGRIMAAQGAGHIVNIASLAGIGATPGLTLYSASKFAVRGFSLAAAAELKSKGVAVSVVCPGPVYTPMLAKQLDTEHAALTFSVRTILQPEDVVDAILKRVLSKRPLELALPATDGFLLKLSAMFPDLAARLVSAFRKSGGKNQARVRAAWRSQSVASVASRDDAGIRPGEIA